MLYFMISGKEDRVLRMLKFFIICNDKKEKKGKWLENVILNKFKGEMYE